MRQTSQRSELFYSLPLFLLYYGLHPPPPRLTSPSFFCTFAANKEYYHQWSVEECHGCSLDLSAFTIEELDNITSEYTLKNTVSPRRYSAAHRQLGSWSSNEGRL